MLGIARVTAQAPQMLGCSHRAAGLQRDAVNDRQVAYLTRLENTHLATLVEKQRLSTTALASGRAPRAGMKTGDADDLARLRQLFSAERESFADFSDVYCVDAADDVLARFARARRGDPEAALAFLREDYAWRKADDAAALRSTPASGTIGNRFKAPYVHTEGQTPCYTYGNKHALQRFDSETTSNSNTLWSALSRARCVHTACNNSKQRKPSLHHVRWAELGLHTS